MNCRELSFNMSTACIYPVPMLVGAIMFGGSNLITGCEMRRDGLSCFEGKEAGERRSLLLSLGPIVLTRCVFTPFCIPPGCVCIQLWPCFCGNRRR